MPLAPGTHLGSYEIVSLLGTGGMGEVYRARDPRLGRDVAIKVLPPAFAEDAERLRRFEHEARVGLKLDHPHIVRTRSCGLAGGLPYMILDLVDGPNLIELQKERRLPWPQACEFVRRLDFKPSNAAFDAAFARQE